MTLVLSTNTTGSLQHGFSDFAFLPPPEQLHCRSLSWFILTKYAGLGKLPRVTVELLMIWPCHVESCFSLHLTHTPWLWHGELVALTKQHCLTAGTPSRLSHEDNTLHPNISVIIRNLFWLLWVYRILTQICQERQLPAPTFVPCPVLCRIAFMSSLCPVCTPCSSGGPCLHSHDLHL